jgi:putative salt-induced outer membrane protein
MLIRPLGLLLAATGALTATTAHAELTPQLRSMLDAAMASGNDGDVDTLAKYIKKASPEDAAQVDHIIADHRKQIAAARQDKLANQTLMQGWKGEGQIGASQSSGNTSTVGISAGLNLSKEGLHWRHKVSALVDYERTDGVTDRNQILAGLESDYKFNARLFAFGSAQYEANRFSGFDTRVSVSGGLGYRVVASPRLTIDLKAGPAWRKTDYIDEPHVNEITGLAAIDALWKATPSLTLSENATTLSGDSNTNVTSLTALSLKINKALSARMSYQATFNSSPPPGYKTTDTLTRFTLVYGF